MIDEEALNLCFEKMMVLGGGNCNYNKMEGVAGRAITEWKDIPMELLLGIVSLVDDDRIVIVASGVCSGWRDAISCGLTHLNLSWCKKNMNSLVLSLVPKFKKLEVLNLRQDTPQLRDDAVEMISNYCHDLQDLDLSKSFRLTDYSLYALAHGCSNLTRLNISGCSAFSDNALAYLAKSCRNLKLLNLCGCVRGATDAALQAIGQNCNQLQSVNLGWCEKVGDAGVTSLANGCPDLRALDLCGCVLITVQVHRKETSMKGCQIWLRCVERKNEKLYTRSKSCRVSRFGQKLNLMKDESVIALASNCPHLRSLGLYYCQNITDKAMYSLAQSGVKNKREMWESVKNRYGEGLVNLNISQCTALTPLAVQAVCDSFPALHTCPGRHSLIISGCLNLTSVHCACAVQAHRALSAIPHPAHKTILENGSNSM